MTDEAAPAPTFKKPRRPANIRKRGASEAEADADADAAPAGRPGNSLTVMRELQRQRQRTKGVALDIMAEGGAAEEGGGEEGGDAGDGGAGLDSTFTAQADASEVDPNMLRYIEEQMKNGGSADGAAEGAADGDEDSLYVAPAHMREAIALGHLRHEQAMVQQGADEQGGAATRWLAGIAEVELSVEERMATVEATEAAKRRAVEQRAQRAAAAGGGVGPSLVIPSNFNANFHAHRRETAQARAPPGGGGGGAGGGGGPRCTDGLRAVESDGAALSAFKRRKH
mmetsp:Transcript_42384/g.137915  ORF Transcript_42384/g.137915 Transcript_42384/m.137915 type:complete len:283 (+) Transcript_42384:49-897(+)